MELKGQTVLITGASDGIGKAIAIRLAKSVEELILLGKNEQRLSKVKELCLERGVDKITIYAVDFLEKDNFEKVLTKIYSRHKNITVLINNAGVWQKMGDIDNVSLSKVDEIITVNLISLIKLTKTVLPILREQLEGKIINIVSKSGYVAQKGQSVYTASKYGVRGFTEVLQEDLKESNITVTGVYQSGTKTKMFSKADENIPNDIFNNFTDPQDLAKIVEDIIIAPNSLWIPEIRISYKK